MTIVDQIARSKINLCAKITQLFAVVMLNYRQPLGDAAWEKMAKLASQEQTNALAFLSGYMMGIGMEPYRSHREQWEKLLPQPKKKK